MGVIPEDKKIPRTNYLKAADFEGDGAQLTVKGFQIIDANDPKYGAGEDDFLVKQGILEVGQTFQFEFIDGAEEECLYSTKSSRFYGAFDKLDPDVGDTILIKRTGTGSETQYTITKV